MVTLKQLLPKKAHRIVEGLITQLMMIAIVGPFFFIFFYMFWSSFKPDYLFFEPGVWVFEPIWDNYAEVIENSDMVKNIANSLFISGFAKKGA